MWSVETVIPSSHSLAPTSQARPLDHRNIKMCDSTLRVAWLFRSFVGLQTWNAQSPQPSNGVHNHDSDLLLCNTSKRATAARAAASRVALTFASSNGSLTFAVVAGVVRGPLRTAVAPTTCCPAEDMSASWPRWPMVTAEPSGRGPKMCLIAPQSPGCLCRRGLCAGAVEAGPGTPVGPESRRKRKPRYRATMASTPSSPAAT